MAFDEMGRPYLIVKEQEKKQRVKGIEAVKANLKAAISVSSALRSSLGPKGMDKMIVSPDGEVLITNDGATIVQKMEIMHPIAHLMVELSMSQDDEIGDGTTGVVVLAGFLAEHALKLLDKGIHPLRISEGFENAADIALSKLEEIAEKRELSEKNMIKASNTALSSKVVSKEKEILSKIAVQAVMSVADIDRKDVNLDLIKIISKTGGSISESKLEKGILIEKEFSHPQMEKYLASAKIAILTCPFEPPKPKTKYQLNVQSAEDYKELVKKEKEYFDDMIKRVEDCGANIVFCQWGFDDEANHLLLTRGIRAVRWVSGTDIELLAMATGARIVPRFEELDSKKLGSAEIIREIPFGTGSEGMISLGDLPEAKAVSILLRGGSKTILDEAHRSVHDAICVIRNMIKDPRMVPGGAASELAMASELRKTADEKKGVDQFAIRSFADSLEQILVCLAENSGVNSINALAQAKKAQSDNSHKYGFSCFDLDVCDMFEKDVLESFSSKKNQLLLATQVLKMILKIDDLIEKVME